MRTKQKIDIQTTAFASVKTWSEKHHQEILREPQCFSVMANRESLAAERSERFQTLERTCERCF